jgi:double zinc ribbon protein
MTTPAPVPPTERQCGSCGATSSGGRFCAECGAPYEGALCAACRSSLTAGAKFCHRCGSAVGAAPPWDARGSSTLPWAIASITLIALIALVAGRNFGLGFNRPAAAPQPEAAADQPVAGDAPFANGDASGDASGAGVVRAPDISAMSPGERADRLFDRVMRLKEEGKQDSVEFFAPMVMSAYQMMGPLNADQHYDLGRIGEVTGVNGLARAEADTILKTDPTHLLGLALAAHAATAANQPAAARQFYRRLLIAAPGETAKALPEYARHRNDIDAAIAEGKKMGIQE